MKKSVTDVVQGCSICQQAKPDHNRYPGLLQPLPVTDSTWSMVSLDFVEGLPTSGHFNCILVVVDKYTKFAHFVPLKHPFTALSVAKVYMDNVYKLHGLPTSLISDRDKVFTRKLWKEIFGLAGVTLRMSSSYHPQIDGQTERVNQCMETFLRCFVHACPARWSQWLPLAESGITLAGIQLWAVSPLRLYMDILLVISALTLQTLVQPLTSIFGSRKEQLCSSGEATLTPGTSRMKRKADKGCSERVFQVGDRVYLKL
jgi:hypothetical protein